MQHDAKIGLFDCGCMEPPTIESDATISVYMSQCLISPIRGHGSTPTMLVGSYLPSIKDLETKFTATPSTHFYINDWNPTSLKLPDPPLLEIEVNQLDEEKKRDTLRRIAQSARLNDEVAGRIPLEPSGKKKNGLTVKLNDTNLRLHAPLGTVRSEHLNDGVSILHRKTDQRINDNDWWERRQNAIVSHG